MCVGPATEISLAVPRTRRGVVQNPSTPSGPLRLSRQCRTSLDAAPASPPWGRRARVEGAAPTSVELRRTTEIAVAPGPPLGPPPGLPQAGARARIESRTVDGRRGIVSYETAASRGH
jgi:hypothetical protein